jgi:site-specific recombinase XerD
VRCTLAGYRLSRGKLDQLLKVASKRTGVAVRYHRLRHSFCSNLALKGIPVPVIKKLARHSTVMIIERYMHVRDDVARNAIESTFC